MIFKTTDIFPFGNDEFSAKIRSFIEADKIRVVAGKLNEPGEKVIKINTSVEDGEVEKVIQQVFQGQTKQVNKKEREMEPETVIEKNDVVFGDNLSDLLEKAKKIEGAREVIETSLAVMDFVQLSLRDEKSKSDAEINALKAAQAQMTKEYTAKIAKTQQEFDAKLIVMDDKITGLSAMWRFLKDAVAKA